MLTQKLILGYLTQLVIRLIMLIAGIVVARIAGPTVIGIVAFGMSFVSVFSFIAEPGIGNAHIKLVSEDRNLGDCIKTFAILKTILIILFVLGVLLYLFGGRLVFNIHFESPQYYYVILIWLATITINQFLYIQIDTFMALTQQAKQDIPSLMQTIITQALRIFVVVFYANAISLSLANLAGVIIIVPFYLYLFRNYPIGNFSKGLAKDYIRITKPFFLLFLTHTFINYFDKILLQYFSNSEQVGFYTAGFSIGILVQTIGFSAGLLFFPAFSAAFAKQDYEYINKTIDKFERFAYIFIMPVVFFLMFHSKFMIIFLLGDRFLPSANVLFVILIGAFFLIINQHYRNLLEGAGFIKEVAHVSLFSLIFFVVLNFICVAPAFLNLKATGSAIAWAANYLFCGLLYRIYVVKFVKKIAAWRNKRFWIYGIINFISFYCLFIFLNVDQNITLKIIFPFVYFIATYLTLTIMGLVQKEDIRMAVKIFDIKSIKNYIKGEISR